MKLILSFFIAAILLSNASCKKQSLITDYSEKIAGLWQWVRTDGGLAFHIHDTPSSTGKHIELKLTADNKYYYYTNGSLTSEGSYSIKMETCIHDHSQKPLIEFSNDQDLMIEKIDEMILELSDNAYDGIGSQYTKKERISN